MIEKAMPERWLLAVFDAAWRGGWVWCSSVVWVVWSGIEVVNGNSPYILRCLFSIFLEKKLAQIVNRPKPLNRQFWPILSVFNLFEGFLFGSLHGRLCGSSGPKGVWSPVGPVEPAGSVLTTMLQTFKILRSMQPPYCSAFIFLLPLTALDVMHTVNTLSLQFPSSSCSLTNIIINHFCPL